MIITKIEPVTKAKVRVYIEEAPAFVLYKGELSRFHIKEGSRMEEETLEQIRTEVLLKRAKLRAMHLLNQMGRTEEQLRQKLRSSEYPQDITEAAIRYVKSFGYINDDAYIRNFAESRKERKSRKEICMLLCQKGLERDRVEEILQEVYEEHSEYEAIEALLRRKKWDPENTDPKEKQKIYAYLMRKGFRYEDIRQVTQAYARNA